MAERQASTSGTQRAGQRADPGGARPAARGGYSGTQDTYLALEISLNPASKNCLFWQCFPSASPPASKKPYQTPNKKNGFQPEVMEKSFCNLYNGGEVKNCGFPRLLPPHVTLKIQRSHNHSHFVKHFTKWI
jgi:hypothetical protein